ncbi:MAG: flagellar protein FliT [Thioalkalivibrio sp.]
MARLEAALAHARAGEWEQAGACDSRCRALVESLIADPDHPDPAGLAEGLTHLRAQYRELLSLAEAERDKLADSMRQSVRARAGALAYEENR